MKNYKILPTEVAKLIGKSDLTVREGIKREYFDFGVAMQLPDSKKYNYTIFPAKVAEFLGISIEELWKRVDEVRNAS